MILPLFGYVARRIWLHYNVDYADNASSARQRGEKSWTERLAININRFRKVHFIFINTFYLFVCISLINGDIIMTMKCIAPSIKRAVIL